MASNLFAKHRDHFQGDHLAFLPLRNEAGPLPILAEWRSIKALLSKVRVTAAPLFDGRSGVLGTAALVRLAPGGFMDWTSEDSDYARDHLRLHLCLVPSPGCCVFSGGESGLLPVGMLTYVNRLVLHSAVNFGETPAIHLVVDLKKPDDEPED